MLAGPAFEIGPSGHLDSKIVFGFFKNILQAGRSRDSVRYGERQAHRLAGIVVGVLAEYDYLDFVYRSKFESLEDLRSGRVNNLSGPLFLVEITDKLRKVRFVELTLQSFFPGLFYLYCQNTKSITSFIVCT